MDYFDWAAAPLINARWTYDELHIALMGRAVALPTDGQRAERNRLNLPVRLLDDVQYREDGFIVSRDENNRAGTMAFNLHFDRALTDEDFVTARVVVNGWESEFYRRFDDDWYQPSFPIRGEAVVRWWILAATGFGHHDIEDEASGNGVDERALRELQEWLLLLPNVPVRELVIGTEVVM